MMKNLSDFIRESYESRKGRKLRVEPVRKSIRERKKDASIRLNEAKSGEPESLTKTHKYNVKRVNESAEEEYYPSYRIGKYNLKNFEIRKTESGTYYAAAECEKCRLKQAFKVKPDIETAAKALINNYTFPNKAFESYGNGNPDIDFDITDGEEPIKSVVTIPRSSYDGYTFGTSVSLAGDIMSALEEIVAYIQNNDVAKGCLIDLEEVEADFNDLDDDEKAQYEDFYEYASEYLNYIYVDPGMAGGQTPCFVDGNLRIESIEEFGERAY